MALYIVSTPIGNLGDITPRALETLKSVPVVLVEKWSDSIKLFNKFEIKPPKFIGYDDRNKGKVTPEILELLKTKDAALITSAGTPAISDPGTDLVAKCYELNIPVIPIPGVSPLSIAVSMCGFSGDFLFAGFFSKKRSHIERECKRAESANANLVFYDSPYRVKKTLQIIAELYPDAKIFLGKEMTKKFEKYLAATAEEFLATGEKNPKFFKGEFTGVINLAN